MNSASPARLAESFEIIVFIWNDLVLGAKTFKECTPNHFWQVFSFFDSVYYRPNFHFYWPVSLFRTIFYWLPKVPNSTPRIIFYKFSVFLTQFTIGQTFTSTGRCLYLERSFIGCQKFQIVHPESFFTNFQFFWLSLL